MVLKLTYICRNCGAIIEHTLMDSFSPQIYHNCSTKEISIADLINYEEVNEHDRIEKI